MSEEKEKYVRPTWDEYFMEVARTIAKRATCDRGRSGCVIAKIAGKKTKEIPVVTWILAVVFIFALAIKAI